MKSGLCNCNDTICCSIADKKNKVYLYLYNTTLSLSQPITHLPSCLIHLSVNVTTSVRPLSQSESPDRGEATEPLTQLVSCLFC